MPFHGMPSLPNEVFHSFAVKFMNQPMWKRESAISELPQVIA
jgi:hypothetical protein